MSSSIKNFFGPSTEEIEEIIHKAINDMKKDLEARDEASREEMDRLTKKINVLMAMTQDGAEGNRKQLSEEMKKVRAQLEEQDTLLRSSRNDLLEEVVNLSNKQEKQGKDLSAQNESLQKQLANISENLSSQAKENQESLLEKLDENHKTLENKFAEAAKTGESRHTELLGRLQEAQELTRKNGEETAKLAGELKKQQDSLEAHFTGVTEKINQLEAKEAEWEKQAKAHFEREEASLAGLADASETKWKDLKIQAAALLPLLQALQKDQGEWSAKDASRFDEIMKKLETIRRARADSFRYDSEAARGELFTQVMEDSSRPEACAASAARLSPVKVSIIVPVYNCEKYLKDCLDSILGQTLQEIEVICINDGSLDQSGKILEEYAAKDSRVTVLSQENRGPGSSRNRGFMAARGEFIQFCDSDDMLVPQALEYSYRKSTENHLDVFYFDAVPVYENSSLEERKASYKTYYKRKPLFREIQSGADLLSSLRKHQSFRASPCLQFIRRSFLLQSQVIFPPGLLQEDNYFTPALMLCASRVSHEPEPLYIRRVRENSIMTVRETFKNAYGYFMCGMAMIDFLDTHKGLKQNGKDALISLIHEMFQSAGKVYMRIGPSEQAKAAEMDERKLAYFLAMARVEKVRIPAEVIGQMKMNPADAFFVTTLYENLGK